MTKKELKEKLLLLEKRERMNEDKLQLNNNFFCGVFVGVLIGIFAHVYSLS